MPTVTATNLDQLATSIFCAYGVDNAESQLVAAHLVDASLAGHDSHGVMRIVQYVQDIETGSIVPGAKIHCLDEWASGAVLDAKGLFGQVACHDAMQIAIDKARDTSIAAVTLRHSNHSGRLGTYVEMAAKAGMIGLVTANGGGAGQWVAPFGGCERRLSTNPLTFGAPSGKEFPIVVDISTSIAPEGKVRHYLKAGKLLPDGWLVDADGSPTNDPNQLYANPAGAILPLGGSSGHKGFGLAMMVDVLSGALSAAGCPRPGDFDPAHGSGLFMLAIDIGRFGAPADFAQQISDMTDYVKSSKPANGFDRVLVPGEFEHEQRQSHRQNGIDLPEQTWQEICLIVKQLNHKHENTTIRLPPLEN
jgi:uncharacterized oxidoreductase